jgi:hypothetical protein
MSGKLQVLEVSRLICKWLVFQIPLSSEGAVWYHYVDKTVTKELLQQLTDELVQVFDKYPSQSNSLAQPAKQSVQAVSELTDPTLSDDSID